MKAHLLPLAAYVLVASKALTGSLGTAFTYQGYLQDANGPVTGPYDLEFKLYDQPGAGNPLGVVTKAQTPVGDGRFTVTLDFGAGAFDGGTRWLEIGVRTHAPAAFAVLAPRQELTPTPYALFAANATSASQVAPGAVSAAGIADGAITAAKLASGQVVTSLNGLTDAVTLTAGANITVAPEGHGLRISASPGTVVTNAGWGISGNSGTTDANFIGTLDGRPFEVRVNNSRAMRLEPGGGEAPNVIAGFSGNAISTGVSGATIAGGGARVFVPPFAHLNEPNAVGASFGTIGGGLDNMVAGVAAVVAGGKWNQTLAWYSSVSGGQDNFIGLDADHAAVGGGQTNIVLPKAHHAVVAGGLHNQVSAFVGTIGGGTHNRVSGPGGTVPGGNGNDASGYNTLAAGTQAQALHDGAFVWADNHYADFASTAPNQFLIRAGNGVGINTTSPRGMLHVEGSAVAGQPQLTLVQPAAGDWARLELQARGQDQWQITAGGQDNALNFWTPKKGDMMKLGMDGTLSVPVLAITGGADVAEPFEVTSPDLPPGSVVVIDEAHPGKLKQSQRAYDRCVAGIISGANGVQPGLSLHQAGVLGGGSNVALTGRVYVLADTRNGAIAPGDLLTTAATPGHAMKVTDHKRAQGAILGKAMTGLANGRGFVLVLVTLQ